MTGEILEREILEQPEVIRRLFDCESDHIRAISDDLRGSFDYIVLAARGTSDNAARYAKYLLGARNQIPVALATPSLFTLYKQPPQMKHALVVGVSQSGRPPDIVSVVQEAREQGRPTLALTNSLDSPLGEDADHVINLNAGDEEAVAATKTYTASLAAFALLSAHLNADREALSRIERLPADIEKTLDENAAIRSRAERYKSIDQCVVIGRGYNYATAFEISLKIQELTQTVAQPYSSADFLHGPVALIRRDFPVLVIATPGAVFEDVRALLRRLQESQAEILLIAEHEGLLRDAQLAMPIPKDVPEWLSPLVTVLPGQLFGLGLARAKGLNPDQPLGLTKITETW
jgi:glucosamine--fructose-6-phosphate aminotransferase (isomerizing)